MKKINKIVGSRGFFQKPRLTNLNYFLRIAAAAAPTSIPKTLPSSFIEGTLIIWTPFSLAWVSKGSTILLSASLAMYKTETPSQIGRAHV